MTDAPSTPEAKFEIWNEMDFHPCAECEEFVSREPEFVQLHDELLNSSYGFVDQQLLNFSLGEVVLRWFGNGTFEVGRIDEMEGLGERVLLMVSTADDEYLQKLTENLRAIRDGNVGNYSEDVLVLLPFQSNETVARVTAHLSRHLAGVPVLVKFIPNLSGRLQARMTQYYQFKQLADPWTHFIKFFIFDSIVARWDRALYLDVGIELWNRVEYVWELYEPGHLLAHNDSYPSGAWKLIDKCSCQWYPDLCFGLTQDLGNTLQVWYFQSPVLLFDTKAVISPTTTRELFQLFNKYNFLQGDQSYVSLYFAVINPKWKALPLRTKDDKYWSYDFCLRGRDPSTLVMTKHKWWC